MDPADIDWQQYIDAYCERTSPAFRAEPLNAVTNAAFLVAAFALSLTLRQSDLPLCEQWPRGTHFLWHLLNALVLYRVTRALLPAPPRFAA